MAIKCGTNLGVSELVIDALKVLSLRLPEINFHSGDRVKAFNQWLGRVSF